MTSTAEAGGVYLVTEGETLASVARLFMVDVQDLRSANELTDSTLRAGDRLRIPDAPASASRPEPVAPIAPATADAPLRIAPERLQQALCREERVYHTVAKGDTLSAISRRYGTGLAQLCRLNSLRAASRLSIGQKLVVRRTGPRTHRVLRGETLTRIAARTRVPVATLRALNRLEGDRLAVGQHLLLEGCDPVAAAGSAAPSLAAATAAGPAPVPAERGGAAAGLSAGVPLGTAPADRVIELAKTMLDIPYRFGGTTQRGLDCSAFVQKVFGLLDIAIPRTAREQFTVGARIDHDELSIGDLVFFRTYASFPSHVGIYLGDNLFIHASSVVRKVTIDSLAGGYYRKRFLGARRLVEDGAQALASAP